MPVNRSPFFVVGDLTRDFIARESIESPSQLPFVFDELTETVGGKAANTARLLASFGREVILLAVAGSNAESLVRVIRNDGVNTSRILQMSSRPTSMYFAFKCRDQNYFFFSPGAETGKDPHVNAVFLQTLETESFSDIYLAVNDGKFAYEMLNRARSQNARTILSAHYVVYPTAWFHMCESLYLTDWIVGNSFEIETLCSGLAIGRIDLHHKYGIELMIETRGKHGVRITGPEKESIAFPPHVSVEDETGAGDAFLAAFLWAMDTSGDSDVSARFGCVMASFSLECQGMLAKPPAWKEIAERYRATYDRDPPTILQLQFTNAIH